MVSDMESDRLDPSEARRIAERAEAAPYVDYPPPPWWYCPTVGAFVAVLAYLATRWLDDGSSMSPEIFPLLALELVFVRWLARRQGAMPTFRRPPPEFRPVRLRYAGGLAVILALVAVAGALAGAIAAAAVAFVTVTPALALYERTFAAAARRTRERLG
jgi:hypothetical protein